MDGTEPGARHGRMRRWPLLLVALPAMVSVWSGWVALGQMTGFGTVHPLPGILPRAAIPLAVTLPVGVEAYAAYALAVWLGPWAVTAAARRFAMWSSAASLVLGGSGQVSYHLLAAAHARRAPDFVTVIVACVPVLVIGCAAALTHLLRDATGDTGAARASLAAPLVAALAARITPRTATPQTDPDDSERDTARDTQDDTGRVRGATRTATPDATSPATPGEPEPRQRERRRRDTKAPEWHARARRLVARDAAISPADLAEKCGVNIRSAQRYLKDHPPALRAVETGGE